MEKALGIKASSSAELDLHRDKYKALEPVDMEAANAVYKRRGERERDEITAWYSDCLDGQMTADEAMKLASPSRSSNSARHGPPGHFQNDPRWMHLRSRYRSSSVDFSQL